ncbi:MAG TPA: TerC/Alx family metal homeostasis membrane protein [Pyrinomonadaceae bacterium]|nr:TerC/Alx family metal homeostasis membrane protein [Pyrinomonadaceae bacterium]
MHSLATSTLAWVGFCIFILVMLAIDLGLFNRKPHEISYRNAAIWSGVWVALALLFAGLLFGPLGWELFGAARHQKGLEFLAGYLIELSLSVDNLFVFLLIFSYFKVPPKYQHRVLYWGVLGALVMRIAMIMLGTELIDRFHWIIYFFGAFLVYTGLQMLHGGETEIQPEDNIVVRFVSRFVPITRHYERRKFFTVVDGKRVGTLLLLVLVVVEVTDLVFAVDSIPAIFGVTTDRFIVYTSNVFAILGLRTFYFLLAGVVEKFHYLKIGLGIVLSFIGVKMLLPLLAKVFGTVFHALGYTAMADWAHGVDDIPIGIALGIVAAVLLASVAASLIWPQKHQQKSSE